MEKAQGLWMAASLAPFRQVKKVGPQVPASRVQDRGKAQPSRLVGADRGGDLRKGLGLQ